MDPALASPRRTPIDQPILESLVIPLAMVVSGELSQNPTKVPFAERHDSIQAFFFH
jgi:hypothetical protein